MTDQERSKVKDSAALRKRILRFFSHESQSRQEITSFLDQCLIYGNPLIFGGCLRDIAIFGIKEFGSDIDIVFDGEKRLLGEICEPYRFSLNKYGGYRGSLQNWDIDIWPLAETWAFREGLVDLTGIESLLKTTIMNWDAIVFDWKNKKLISKESYLKDLNEGYLDIILEENPNPLGATVKILRTIAIKGTTYLSKDICSFLTKNLNNRENEKIIEKEFKTYRNSFLSANFIEEIKKLAYEGEDQIFPTRVTRYFETKSLLTKKDY